MQQSYNYKMVTKTNKNKSKNKFDIDELQQKGSILSQFYDSEQAKKLIADFNKKVDKIKKERNQQEYQKRFQKYKDRQEELERQEQESRKISDTSEQEEGKHFVYIKKNQYNYKFVRLEYEYQNNRIESKEHKCNVCKRKVYFDPRFIHHRTNKQVALESPYKEFYSKPRVHYCEPYYRILYDPIESNILPREERIGHMLEYQDFEHCRICRQPQNILWLHMFLQNHPGYKKW